MILPFNRFSRACTPWRARSRTRQARRELRRQRIRAAARLRLEPTAGPPHRPAQSEVSDGVRDLGLEVAEQFRKKATSPGSWRRRLLLPRVVVGSAALASFPARARWWRGADGRSDEREHSGLEMRLVAVCQRVQRSAEKDREPVDGGPRRVLNVRPASGREDSGLDEVVDSRSQMVERSRLVGPFTRRVMVSGRECRVEEARFPPCELEIGLADGPEPESGACRCVRPRTYLAHRGWPCVERARGPLRRGPPRGAHRGLRNAGRPCWERRRPCA